jgi:SAM-dependent methyltransferase
MGERLTEDQEGWERGKRKEVVFWWGIVKTMHEKYNVHKPLPPYFGRLIGNKTSVRIADLGCGAFCTVGDSWEGVKVTVVPSDILANEYWKILDEFEVVPLLPVAQQDMERLTYGDGEFDIVHCVNALDHTYDPFLAIREMVRVCKPGGWVYLCHMSEVGKGANYHGLHRWDLRRAVAGPGCVGKWDCWFSRPGGKGFLLSECHPGFITTNGRIDWPGHGDRTVSTYHKPEHEEGDKGNGPVDTDTSQE